MFCALVSLVLPAAGNADTSEKITLAVMPFNPQGGMSEDKARILDDLVASQMIPYTQYKIITAKDIEGLLGFDALKQAFDCNANSCMQELGGALGVSQIITGSISKLGSKVIFTLTRIDTQRAEVLGRGSASTQADDDDQLINGLAQSLRAVMLSLHGQAPPKVAMATPEPAPIVEVVTESSSDAPGALTWSLWTTGALSIAGGVVLWNKAATEAEDSYRTDAPGSQWDAYEAPKTVTLSFICSAVGGSLITAGLINWLFFDGDDESNPQAAITVHPSGTTFSVGGTW